MGGKSAALFFYLLNPQLLNGSFTLELGYNMFWKQAEQVSLKSTCSTSGIYSEAVEAFDTETEFNLDTANSAWTIKKENMNTSACSTPSQITHKLFTGVGYITKTWDYPVMFGAGAAYEIPSSNISIPEGYSVWAKVGVGF